MLALSERVGGCRSSARTPGSLWTIAGQNTQEGGHLGAYRPVTQHCAT